MGIYSGLGSIVFCVTAQQLDHHFSCSLTVHTNAYNEKQTKVEKKKEDPFPETSMRVPFLTVNQCFIHQPQQSVFLLHGQVPVNDPLAHLSDKLQLDNCFFFILKPPSLRSPCCPGSYLIQIGRDECYGVAGSCHFNETAVHCVSHRCVLVHAVEQVTQAENTKHQSVTGTRSRSTRCAAGSHLYRILLSSRSNLPLISDGRFLFYRPRTPLSTRIT